MSIAEQDLLAHYGISNLTPMEWPRELDQEDGEGGSTTSGNRTRPGAPVPHSMSSYATLQRMGTNRRSMMLMQERAGGGNQGRGRRDEADALGGNESIVRVLRSKGIPVENDLKLKNQFLLSSPTFSASLYLSQVHANESTQSLLQGLDFLSRSIDQKSANLKSLVETNFERFVRAKATISDVYTEMRNQGASSDTASLRRASRSQRNSIGHYRSFSNSGTGPTSPGGSRDKTQLVENKNALVADSEFGVIGIKSSLTKASERADDVWGPAMGGRDREKILKEVLATVEQHRGIFEVGHLIADAIKRRDHEALIEEYGRARRYATDAKDIADHAARSRRSLTDAQIHQIVITSRMWVDVEDQIEAFKRDTWRKLTGIHTSIHVTNSNVAGNPQEEHMELISVLLELGVQDNPIWVWLLSRYDYLKTKIIATSIHFRVEVEVLRRRMANSEKPNAQVVASYLKTSIRQDIGDRVGVTDSPDVVELWERIQTSLQTLLSSQDGILGEVLDFWETAQSFIDGKTQKTLPTGLDGASRKHHRLSTDGVKDLQSGATELIVMIRDAALSFFVDPPVEDLNALLAELPQSQGKQGKAGSNALDSQAFKGSNFDFDPNNLPAAPTQTSETWVKFAFWPPYSNCLSGVYHLSRILILIGTAASEMAALRPIGQGNGMLERLRSLVGACRERCVQAACASWSSDAEYCKGLEDWTRSPDKRDATKMPSLFKGFEDTVLSGMQKVLYISEAMAESGSAEVVLPPPAKLLQMVRGQFVTSLYKALSGMVENAEKSLKTSDDVWSSDPEGLASPTRAITPMNMTSHAIDASDRTVRMLLTLSNLQVLRTDVVPQLITHFETAFSVKLTDETKTIRDVLGQIDARLFQSCTRPAIDKIRKIIHEGVAAPDWEPRETRPTEVRAYVYDALLLLVLVHTQVSTTATNLTSQILSYLLEQTSLALLEAFKKRPKYTLAALMQATLDVEFVAQTLNQFTTDKAGELQSQIYVELDRGTDQEARMKLQNELPEMRNILKGLRESSKAEFACFKKQRPPKASVERNT